MGAIAGLQFRLRFLRLLLQNLKIVPQHTRTRRTDGIPLFRPRRHQTEPVPLDKFDNLFVLPSVSQFLKLAGESAYIGWSGSIFGALTQKLGIVSGGFRAGGAHSIGIRRGGLLSVGSKRQQRDGPTAKSEAAQRRGNGAVGKT